MIRGVGVDLVHVPGFVAQFAVPGTRFGQAFTDGERAVGPRRLAGRWAVKEAVVKAWSQAVGAPPLRREELVWAEIEVVTDQWGRPHVETTGTVARLTAGLRFHVSISHDGDYAVGMAVAE